MLRTELQLPTKAIHDAKSISTAPNLVAGLDQSSESTLSSVSSAEVYFNRPSDDAREEYATGYNPFWAVRLAPTNDFIRASALALRGSAENSLSALATLSSYDGEEAVALPTGGSAFNLSEWTIQNKVTQLILGGTNSKFTPGVR